MTVQSECIGDFHVHSPYCGHAYGKLVDYVKAAIGKGMKQICFTDHLGRYYLTSSQKKRYWDWGMKEHNLIRYFDELDELKDTFADQITIFKGLEVDYVEGAEDICLSLLQRYEFDFLLGSIHCLPHFGWKHIATYTSVDTWSVFLEYFRVIESLMHSQLFDSLSHMDFIWRYIKWPAEKTNEVFSLIEKAVQTAQNENMAIEINSNGFLWAQLNRHKDGDPLQTLIDSIEKYNVSITIGSDAHKPEFVAKAFPQITALLKHSGINEYSTFDKRNRIAHKLS